MRGLMEWLEKNLTPVMNKINHNTWIVVLKDSINQLMPLVFLGSLFSLLTLPGTILKISCWPDFQVPYGWSMGMVSLLMAFLIPVNLMEKIRLRKSRMTAGMAGVILFAIVVSPQFLADGAAGFSHAAFGAGGMFIAMVTGIITGFLMKKLGKFFNSFREDANLPDFVRAWFEQMIPIGAVIVLGWIVVDVLNIDVYHGVLAVFRLLQAAADSTVGLILLIFIMTALYSMGISAWVLTPFTTPVMLAGIQENIASGASHVFTVSFNYAYLTVGGAGCTLGLAFLLLSAKSMKLKSLGKAVFVPSLFNINEPLVFGMITWNPIMMLPMVLNSVLAAALALFFTRVIPLGVIPKVLFQLWYCPSPFAAWLATGCSIGSVLLVILIFAVTTAVWLPFFKVYDNQCLKEETTAKDEKDQ